jgi:hypothetical protein
MLGRPTSRAVPEIPLDKLSTHIGSREPLTVKPSAQIGNEQKLITSALVRITFLL